MIPVYFEAKFGRKVSLTVQKFAAEVQVYLGLFFTVQCHLSGQKGTWEYDECSNKLCRSTRKRSGLNEKVAAISK